MKPIEKINLTCLKSCTQVWDDMEPNENGKLCQKCKEIIIDFRKLSDKEITEIHALSPGKVCGIYTKQQLNLKTHKTPTKRRKIPNLLIGLLGLITATNSTAQTAENTIETPQQTESLSRNGTIDSLRVLHNKTPNANNLVIHGTLKDENEEVIFGAIVYIKGTKIGTNSNFDGKYHLDITNQIDSLEQIILVYSYLGYEIEEITLEKEELLQKHHVKIDISFRESDDGYIGLYIVKKPSLFKRIGASLKQFFKKK